MFQSKNSKKAVTRNRIISSFQVGVGGFFGFIFGLTALSCIINLGGTVTIDAAIVIFILFALFLYMFISGIRRKRLAGRYFTYIKLLDQRQVHSIDQLAAILNAPPQVVKSNLERMIKKKFLEFAYIDNETNSIVDTRVNGGTHQIFRSETSSSESKIIGSGIKEPNMMKPESEPVQMVQVVCRNCGAPNKVVKDSTAECVYCGSVIS